MKKNIILAIMAAICILAGIVMQFADPFVPADSIAVIGGADGPTSMYVSATAPYELVSPGLIALGVIIAAIAIIIFIKNKKN